MLNGNGKNGVNGNGVRRRDTGQKIIDIPREYPEGLRAGADYMDLISRPGWKRLLDDMEGRANRALAALRNAEYADPIVIKGLRDQWREAEESLKFVQICAAEAIEQRKAIIMDLEIKTGLDFELDDDGDDVTNQRIMDFMGIGEEI